MRAFLEDLPGGHNRGAYAPTIPDYVEDVVLAADTLVRVPIPAGAVAFCIFSFTGDVRVKLGVGSTALALPSATTTDGSGSELNPAARRIPAALGDGTTTPTHLCLRARSACEGSIAFYR